MSCNIVAPNFMEIINNVDFFLLISRALLGRMYSKMNDITLKNETMESCLMLMAMLYQGGNK